MKNLLIFLVLFYSSFTIIAQISYEKRLEFELKDGYDNEEIFEFGEVGFLMCSQKEESSLGEIEWKYELFNSNLESVNSRSISISKKYYADETYRTDKRTHTLCRDRKGNFSIVSVEAASLEIAKVDGIVPKKSWIKEMVILGDYAFFNASIKKVPYLFSVNWKTGKQNFIPVSLQNYRSKKTQLIGFQVLESSNEIFLYIKAQVEKRKSELYIIRLNDKGEKEDVFNLSKNIDENIIDVSASKLSNGKYIFTGTYSTKSINESEGLFFCQAQENDIEFIKFYNFLDLNNFLSYLPERKQEKIIKKKERKEGRGKEFKLKYQLATHDVEELADGYIFMGEAYYPTYITESYTTTSYLNGIASTITHTNTVFDGYRYTHAVVAKFNKEGILQWDQTFEMWPAHKPFYVKRFISTAEKNQNFNKLVFASRNKIVSKSINYNGSVIQDSESEEIDTPHEGDKEKRSFSNVDFWYDKYFIAYGRQIIKNKENKDVKRKRKVYFISKIKFE